MSYSQVKTLEPEVDEDFEELAGPSKRSGDEHVPHAYFKSSAALHTAISVAAGTVCGWAICLAAYMVPFSYCGCVGDDAFWIWTRWDGNDIENVINNS
jgi:hypothetical protein